MKRISWNQRSRSDHVSSGKDKKTKLTYLPLYLKVYDKTRKNLFVKLADQDGEELKFFCLLYFDISEYSFFRSNSNKFNDILKIFFHFYITLPFEIISLVSCICDGQFYS